MKWFSGQRELPSIYTTRDNYASAELAFVPEQVDNGAELRCEATNVAIEDNDNSPFVASRQLNVQFAPAYVQVSIMPESPKAGQNATLICETGSSRPAASVDWWSNGKKVIFSIHLYQVFILNFQNTRYTGRLINKNNSFYFS